MRLVHSSSMSSLGGRSSGLGLSRTFSSGSLCGGSQSVTRSMRDMDTPPGAITAFEAHRTLVQCPPPLRSQVHATRRADRLNSESPF